MLNNLDRDQHKALPRQRQIQPSASMKEVPTKKRLQKPAHHCHCWSRPVGHLRNEHLKHRRKSIRTRQPPNFNWRPLEKNSSPSSTRCSNSK